MNAAQIADGLRAITHFQDQLEELHRLSKHLDPLQDPALVPAILDLFERHGQEDDFGLFHAWSNYIEQFDKETLAGDSTVGALVVASVKRAPCWVTLELVGYFVSEEEAEALKAAAEEADEAEPEAEPAEEEEEEEELSAADPRHWARYPPRDGVLSLGSVTPEEIGALIAVRDALPDAVLRLWPPRDADAIARLGELGRPLHLDLSDLPLRCFEAALGLGQRVVGLSWMDPRDDLHAALLARVGENPALRHLELNPQVSTEVYRAFLARLPDLRHLRLRERHHLPALAALPHPERLATLDATELRGAATTADAVPLGPADLAVLGRLTGLQELRLSLNQLDGDALGALSGLQALRQLWLGGVTWKKPQLDFLRGTPALEELILDVGPLSPAGADALSGLARLRRLTLYRTKLGPRGVEALAKLGALEELTAQSAALTDDDLKQLGGLARLRLLKTSSAKITDASVPTLRGLGALQELTLDSATLTDAGVAALVQGSAIRELELTRMKGLSDEALAPLKGLAGLRRLNLGGTKISKKARKAFEAARPRVHLQDYAGQ